MKISYKWLIEYLPIDEMTSRVVGNPHKIAEILTSVGLEVESLEKYEQVKNELEGLIIAEETPLSDPPKTPAIHMGSLLPLQIIISLLLSFLSLLSRVIKEVACGRVSTIIF